MNGNLTPVSHVNHKRLKRLGVVKLADFVDGHGMAIRGCRYPNPFYLAHGRNSRRWVFGRKGLPIKPMQE
jgi:hypothetical protein